MDQEIVGELPQIHKQELKLPLSGKTNSKSSEKNKP